MTGSLAYRKNEAAILRGDVPQKYLRLLPFITGDKILEIGSAEGVLALLMADAGKGVVAIERSDTRFRDAQRLKAEWLRLGKNVVHSFFFCAAIQDRLDFLDIEKFDTLVAVRMIYYLRDDLDRVFAEVAKRIPNVVLCGNGNRAARWRQGIKEETKADNYYASKEGMTDLLERHGYTATVVCDVGDEIVVGRRND